MTSRLIRLAVTALTLVVLAATGCASNNGPPDESVYRSSGVWDTWPGTYSRGGYYPIGYPARY